MCICTGVMEIYERAISVAYDIAIFKSPPDRRNCMCICPSIAEPYLRLGDIWKFFWNFMAIGPRSRGGAFTGINGFVLRATKKMKSWITKFSLDSYFAYFAKCIRNCVDARRVVCRWNTFYIFIRGNSTACVCEMKIWCGWCEVCIGAVSLSPFPLPFAVRLFATSRAIWLLGGEKGLSASRG